MAKLITGENDLSTTHPELAKQWSDKNSLKPTEVSYGSNKKVLWICKKNHEWEQSIKTRSRNEKCPFCAGQRIVVGENDLNTTHPELAKQWSDKNSLKPTEVSYGSGQKIWWECNKGHEYEAVIKTRSKNSFCPFCQGFKIVQGENDLAAVHPNLIKQWSDKNSLKPTEVSYGSKTKVWWVCDNGHEYKASILNRKNGSACPFCAGQRIVVGENDLDTTHPELIKQWSDKNSLKPTEVSYGSNKKVLWICKKNHEWEGTINDRISKNIECPFCSGKRIVIGENDLNTTHPELIKQWSDKNSLKPTEVSYGSHKKVWWICDNRHEYQTAVYNKAGKFSKCKKCSDMVSKAESEICLFLDSINIKYKQSVRSLIPPKEVDIYISSHNIAIEYNGLYWHSEKYKNRTYHYDKWKTCNDIGVQLIQIWEDDWLYKSEIVKNMLAHKIGMSTQERVYGRKTKIVKLDYHTVRNFLNLHHIQGGASGSLYLGLEHDSLLVAVMVLKKRSEGVWELVRYATKVNVIGGFSKLLKYFESNFCWTKIVTFADLCVSDGGLYKDNGFQMHKLLKPDYKYFINNSNSREHKFGYRLKRFRDDPDLIWEDGLSERELAGLNGLLRVYDAGKQRWVKTK